MKKGKYYIQKPPGYEWEIYVQPTQYQIKSIGFYICNTLLQSLIAVLYFLSLENDFSNDAGILKYFGIDQFFLTVPKLRRAYQETDQVKRRNKEHHFG